MPNVKTWPHLSPLQVLLPAASLLQLMDVRQVCCEFLQSQLHPSNCLGIRAFADLHTCTQLLGQAHAYAGKLFAVLTSDPESFLQLCVHDIHIGIYWEEF